MTRRPDAVAAREDVIMATDGRPVYVFSLTKNVMQMLIGVSLMLLIFLSVARNFKKYGTKAPRGIHSVVEVVVMFIRDQIAKPPCAPYAPRRWPVTSALP